MRVSARCQNDAQVITKAFKPLKYRFEMSGEWHWLPGAAYGLGESVVTGTVALDDCSAADLADLDACMNVLLETPFTERASENPLISRILYWYCEVQRNVRIPVLDEPFFEKLSPGSDSDEPLYRIALPSQSRVASLKTLGWLQKLVMQSRLVSGVENEFDLTVVQREYQKLKRVLRKYATRDTNSLHFLRAAQELDIPRRMILPGVYAYGTGCHSRLLNSSITDQTSALGVGIARSKSQSARLIRQAGLPAPRHVLVESAEDAQKIAREIGYPVVVKPDNEDQGRGVAPELFDAEAVKNAYAAAREFSSDILVEKFCLGEDYRVTVFRGEVIKTMHRRAGGVVGDGVSTVTELLEREQGEEYLDRLYRQIGEMKLQIDDEALQLLSEQNLEVGSIPEQGCFVYLRKRRNISSGAKQTLISNENIHPDNIRLAVGAARALHLDLAGIDLIIPDISESWLESGGTILEVNAQPQIVKKGLPTDRFNSVTCNSADEGNQPDNLTFETALSMLNRNRIADLNSPTPPVVKEARV